MGMQLFGQVLWNDPDNNNLNFETFLNSFCALCAVATGDGWKLIMNSVLRKRSILYQCIEGASYQDYASHGDAMQGCGAGTEGIIYFFSFYLIVNLIFLNLFIAIILDSFQETQLKDQRLFNQESLEYFREHWANYDPQGTSFIPIYKLRDLLANLGPPLGFSDRCKEDRDMQDRFIGQLKLPIYNDFSSYQFLDVLDALSLRAMVLDRIITMRKSQKEVKEQKSEVHDDISLESSDVQLESSPGGREHLDKVSELEHKEVQYQIEWEVNRVLYQDEAARINSVKEVRLKESEQAMSLKSNGFRGENSELHRAAEKAAKQMIRFLHIRREARKNAIAQAALALGSSVKASSGESNKEASNEANVKSSRGSQQNEEQKEESDFEMTERQIKQHSLNGSRRLRAPTVIIDNLITEEIKEESPSAQRPPAEEIISAFKFYEAKKGNSSVGGTGENIFSESIDEDST